MAWLPIGGIVPQATTNGNQANGMVLKFYEVGTLTPLALATDSTGATQTVEFILDTEGYTTLSTARVIPHANTKYRVVLYLDQTDADNNDTGSAVFDIDDVDSVGSLSDLVDQIDFITNGIPIEFDNLAEALADANNVVSDGDFVRINENIAGSGIGEALYQATTVNPNFNIVNPLMANATLYLKLIVNGDINVAKAGIVADGSTDFTANMKQVNDYADSEGVGLIIVNNPDDFELILTDIVLTVSLRGEGMPTIKSGHTTQALTTGVRYLSPSNKINISGIIFDGNVSVDPPSWNSGNYNTFTGATSLAVQGLSKFSIRDCQFNNSASRGIYMEDCLDGIIENCHSNRTRNNFGDGFYILDSNNIEVVACTAEDHTRIGFVCETGTYNVKFERCQANNGHDGSTNYGGGELNVGFWAENSTDITIDSCGSTNQWDIGYTISTTNAPSTLPDGRVRAEFNIINSTCAKIGQAAPYGGKGFNLASLGTTPATVNVTNCAAFQCDRAFLSAPFGSGSNVHNYTNCHGQSDGGTSFSMIFLVQAGVNDGLEVNIKDCTGEFSDYTSVNNDSVQASDIGSFDPIRAKLSVDGYTNLDGAAVFKNISTVRELNYSFKRVNGRFLYQNVISKLTIEDSIVSGTSKAGDGNLNADSEVYLKNVDILGEFLIGEMLLRGNCRLLGDSARIWHFYENATANGRSLMDCRIDIEKDISTIASLTQMPIYIEYRSADFGSALVSGTWLNTGAAVTGVNGGFINLSFTGNSTFANGLIIDDSVDNAIINTVGAPVGSNYAAGAQRIDMHKP